MSLYSVVDHRGPRWLPHKVESHHVSSQQFLVNMAFAIFSPFWISVGYFSLLIPIIFLALLIIYNVIYRKWVYKIPRGGNYLDDYHTDKYMAKMQNLYKKHPDPELEKILIGAYDKLRHGDFAAIQKRAGLMEQYVQTIPAIEESDNEELEFKMLIETRRQMKKEGLL